MAKGRGDEPYKLRNSRWKTLITLLYHKGLKRPEPNRVATSPSELTKLTGLGKVHLTIDNLKFLEDMGYIKDVKCRYGSVALIIVTDLIAAKDSPETTQVDSGSPSDSALAGGHNNLLTPSKFCRRCEEQLPLEAFGKDSSRKDGLKYVCKSCRKLDTLKYREEHRQELVEYMRNYRKVNPAKNAESSAQYRASKLQATPNWLTEEDKEWISWFYKQAAKMEEVTGLKFHVDHIEPLNGKDVCGLHVPQNLQVIPAEENMSKGNRKEMLTTEYVKSDRFWPIPESKVEKEGITCQERQQELVAEDQKKHSEKSSTNSINQVKQKSRLRLRSTSE